MQRQMRLFKQKDSYIIPKSEILKIIKIAQTNKKLSAKLEAFQRTSIKNISESMTANNWGKSAKIP